MSLQSVWHWPAQDVVDVEFRLGALAVAVVALVALAAVRAVMFLA